MNPEKSLKRKRACNFSVSLSFFFLLLIPQAGLNQSQIDLNIQKVLEVGRDNLLFASVVSVVEDEESNFYVLDRIEHKVHKFSPQGKLILSFGQKGQGPGDFQNPHLIAYSQKKQIIVADELYDISFLNPDGSFIDRIHLDGRLGVGYIGEDRYYAWMWGKEDRTQVMVDVRNRIIETFFHVPTKAFSVSAPDSSGRLVMFNYSRQEFAPSLIFAHSGPYSAVGVGDVYDIYILDGQGKTIARIKRDIEPDEISKKEKKALEKDIEEYGKERGWPGNVIRDLFKIIPDIKTYFDRVLLTEKYAFIFRIKKDITDDGAPIPVDLFTTAGKFLGESTVKEKPVHISEKHMYFVRSDKEGNLYLEKAVYRIDRN